jgi:glycolate oxidase iron-sulfur subunit
MRPWALRLVARGLRIYQKTGFDRLVRRLGLTRILPADLRRLEPQTPRISPCFSDERIAEDERPEGAVRYRVALLTGCVQDIAFSEINRDTADVLLANGCNVHTPPAQGCCGSLHGHNGEPGLAAELARRMIDRMPPEEYDAIITNAGGCGAHLRHYKRVLADDPRYAARAEEWDRKVRDIHEWLVEIGFRKPGAGEEAVVTYHESCHLAHGQKVVKQPREILKSIPGVRLVELPESSWCCGSAGVYSITQPEQSAALLARKVSHIAGTGARWLATSNPGCHLQVANGLRAAGVAVEVVQPVTLLARAYRAEKGAGKKEERTV